MDKKIFIELAQEIYKLTVLFPKKEPLRYELRRAVDEVIAEFIKENNGYFDDIGRGFELMESYLEVAGSQDWVAPAKIAQIKEKIARIARDWEKFAIGNRWDESKIEKIIQETQEQTIDDDFGIIEPEMREPDFILMPQESKSGLIESLPRDLMEIEVPEPLAAVASAAADEPEAESETSQTELTSAQIARQNRIMEFLKERGGAQVWEIQKIFPNLSKRTIRRDFRSLLEQGLIEATGEHNTTAYKLKINLA